MKRYLVILPLFVLATPALAGTASSNMGVSATVAASCTISAGALAFGAYDPVAGGAVDGTATLSVACTAGSTSEITLGQGANADLGSNDDVPLRQMASGADRLSYTLYQDNSRSVVWGNSSAASAEYVSGSAVASNVTVYGTIDAGQDVPAGSYSDTVTATITF